MKRTIAVATTLAAALCTVVSAAKVDSIVYDQGSEWRVFQSEGPSIRFTIQGTTLWQATDKKVTTVNTVAKKSAFQTLSTLGRISAAGVRAMATDSTGSVWIGTGDGLAMLKGATWTVFTTEQGLPANAVNVIIPHRDGRVFVGTDEGAGVFEGGAWKKLTKENGLRANAVRTIAFDDNGSVWFGTSHGISVLARTGQWSSHSMDNEMSWNDVKALAWDGRKSTMWAAVGAADINCYDGKEWKVFTNVQEGVVALMVDTHSRVWLASTERMQKFNGDEWITEQQRIGVPCKLVTQMHRDNAGNLWFASETGVVSLKNPYPF